MNEKGLQPETSMPIRHFLVTRRFGKLERVRVYDDSDEAVRAYEQEERECGWFNHPLLPEPKDRAECVLLGADSLSTCIATHGNWFDEPSGLDDALRKAVKHYESDLRELADG